MIFVWHFYIFFTLTVGQMIQLDYIHLYNIYMNFQPGCFNRQNILTYFDIEKYKQLNLAGPFLRTCLDHPCAEPEKAPLFCIPIATGKITTRSCVRVNSCIAGQQRVGPPAELSWKASKLGEFLFTPKLCGSAIWRIMAKNVLFGLSNFEMSQNEWIYFLNHGFLDWFFFMYSYLLSFKKNIYYMIWLLFHVQLIRSIRENGGELFVSSSHFFKETTNMRIYIYLEIMYNIYIYIPGTHLSSFLPPREDLFQSKQRSFRFQVCV